MMTKRRKVIAWVVAGVMAMACNPDGGSVDKSGHDPQDQQVDQSKKRVVTIKGRASYIPYIVHIVARDENNQVEVGEHPVAGDYEFSTTLDYTSGRRINIQVQVKAPKPGGTGRCYIEDGPMNRDESFIDGNVTTRCEITTTR